MILNKTISSPNVSFASLKIHSKTTVIVNYKSLHNIPNAFRIIFKSPIQLAQTFSRHKERERERNSSEKSFSLPTKIFSHSSSRKLFSKETETERHCSSSIPEEEEERETETEKKTVHPAHTHTHSHTFRETKNYRGVCAFIEKQTVFLPLFFSFTKRARFGACARARKRESATGALCSLVNSGQFAGIIQSQRLLHSTVARERGARAAIIARTHTYIQAKLYTFQSQPGLLRRETNNRRTRVRLGLCLSLSLSVFTRMVHGVLCVQYSVANDARVT